MTLDELRRGAGRRHRAGRVRRRPPTRVVALVVTADRHHLGRPRRTATRSTRCSAGCCPTSTWRRPTCPTRWARSCATELAGRLDDLADAPGRAGARRGRRPTRRADPVRRAGRCAVDAAARVRRPPGHRRPVGDLVAGPPYDAAALGDGRASSPGPRVARAEDEVSAAAKEWPGARVLTGADATRGRGLRARRDGRRPARRRARPALRGEPDVLRSPARRRPVVRLRHRPAPAGAGRRAAVGLRGRPLDGALGRGADRDDHRLAARRRPLRDRVARRRSTTRRRTTSWSPSTSGWPPGVDPPPPWPRRCRPSRPTPPRCRWSASADPSDKRVSGPIAARSSTAEATRARSRHVDSAPLHQPRPARTRRPVRCCAVEPGTRLEVRFRRRGLGLSRWQVVDRPGTWCRWQEGDHGFLFLVFDGDAHRASSRCGWCVGA